MCPRLLGKQSGAAKILGEDRCLCSLLLFTCPQRKGIEIEKLPEGRTANAKAYESPGTLTGEPVEPDLFSEWLLHDLLPGRHAERQSRA